MSEMRTACAAGCTNTALCPPGRCVRAGTGNAIVDAFDGMIERAEAPRNREADRARFPDPAFNRWLDEGIADGGWTVWDQIGSTVDAWAGWQNRAFYSDAPRPEAQPVAWRFRFPSGGRWHYTEHGPHEHSKQGLTWEPLHAAPASPRALPEHCTKPGADGKPCGLLPPCPDCGRAVHDVPEGA